VQLAGALALTGSGAWDRLPAAHRAASAFGVELTPVSTGSATPDRRAAHPVLSRASPANTSAGVDPAHHPLVGARRKSSMIRLLAAASMSGVLLMTVPAAFAADCLERLSARTYTCQHKSSFDPNPTESTLTFLGSPTNVVWSGFTPLVTFATCNCATDGNFKNPKFKHSLSKWQCLGALTTGLGTSGLVIEGMVNAAGKITKVSAQTYIDDFGLVIDRSTYILDCDLD
jgi:hypothetical protein